MGSEQPPHNVARNRQPAWEIAGTPRQWQTDAFATWLATRRGVVEVVTGAGKTYLAMMCILDAVRNAIAERVLITVPTVVLLDQWHVALKCRLHVADEDLSLIGGGYRGNMDRRIVVGTQDALRRSTHQLRDHGPWFLVVDECHHAVSPAARSILSVPTTATLGLSATPHRQYDDWFSEYAVPHLGPVVYTYDYARAVRDGVLCPFELWNVRVPLTEREKEAIAAIGRQIARLRRTHITTDTAQAEPLKRLLMKLARVSQMAALRIPAAVQLAQNWRGSRGIVFHESIAAANVLADRLQFAGFRARTYHSGMGPPSRYESMRQFEAGQADFLVACRALDEGLDVPAAQVGLIVASTATTRQRIQRLGRVLRPAPGKDAAVVATLYALDSERERLVAEAAHLEGVASVRWFEAHA